MRIICDYSEYYYYLMDLVGISDKDSLFFTLVRLFERAFYWKNPIDGGLQGHVEELRANAIRYGNLSPVDIPNRDPSVLEILVVLSIFVDLRLLYDSENPGGNAAVYFIDLIEALGFDCTTDSIDIEIDRFLDGENRISSKGTTLWQQCNSKYGEQFDIITGDE